MKHFLALLITLLRYPFLIFDVHRIKKTVVFNKCRLHNRKFMTIENSSIGYGSTLICFGIPGRDRDNLGICIKDSYIADFAYISSGGRISIDHASIAPNVFIGSYKHDLSPLSSHGPAVDQYSIVIEKGCIIGQNVSIFGNVHIGENCFIGACAVVTKDIPSFSMAVGNPAKVIKKWDFKTNSWISI